MAQISDKSGIVSEFDNCRIVCDHLLFMSMYSMLDQMHQINALAQVSHQP